MAILGYAQLQHDALPSTWDRDEMNRVRMAAGVSFADIVEEADAAVQEASQAFIDDPRWASLLAVQDDGEIKYGVGQTGGVKELTEQGVPDPKHGKTRGHQINLRDWGDGLGWSHFGLRDRSRADLDEDIRTAVTSVTAHLQWLTLTAFFRKEAVTFGANGKSIPFADGGTADSEFVPVTSPDGTVFANTHNHYLRQDTFSQANFNLALAHIWEHGKHGVFDVVASSLDASDWQGITGFKKPTWTDLNYQQDTEVRANIADNDMYIGYIEGEHGVARIWLSGRIPTNYWGIYKSNGALDAMNPLRMRINPNTGFGFKVLPGQYVNSPNNLAVYHAQHNVGVGADRTNAVLIYVNGSGSYVSPIINQG